MKKHRPLSKRISSIWLLSATLLALSCQNSTLYHSYRPVPTTGWHRNDTLVYTLPQALPALDCRYEIGIRHKDSYPYRDLWLTINGDTVHLYLADSIGNWTGSGIGEVRQCTFPVRLRPSGQDSVGEFRIMHIMQDHPLTGILHLGLKINTPH